MEDSEAKEDCVEIQRSLREGSMTLNGKKETEDGS